MIAVSFDDRKVVYDNDIVIQKKKGVIIECYYVTDTVLNDVRTAYL